MKTARHFFFPSLTIFLTSLTLLVATAAQAQVPSYVPTSGLVGYWPFNGNANDESGNGNNGTVNGATLTEDRFGNGNKAYEFFNSTIEVPHNQNLGFGSDASFSVSFWFNKTTNNSPYHFMGKRVNGSPTFNWQLGGTNNETSFGSSPPGLYVGAIFSSAQLNSVWTLLTGVYDNGNWKLFQNGLQVLSNNAQAGPDSNCPLTFGNSGSYEYFGGSLDDIGIWNRALTADEVLALYNGCNVTPQVVTGNTTPSAFANSIYTCNNNAGSIYTWTVNNGVIVSGQGTNSVTILWGAEGVGSVTVAETTADGCVGDEVIYDVNVQCVVSGNEITGPVGPEAFSNSTYTCNGAANSTYNWTVTNGVIASGQGTNTVNILWASTGLGNVSVVETTAEGCVGSELSQDVVVIPTNVEELLNQMLLYPNPATTELNLQTTSDLIGSDLFVFDALGKQIFKQQILSTNTTINTSSFAAGNYVVKVGGGVKKFEVKR